MRDSTDSSLRDDGRPLDDGATGSPTAAAAASARRVVGVVRVLRGRLAAPCRCCSDAAAARLQHDDERRGQR